MENLSDKQKRTITPHRKGQVRHKKTLILTVALLTLLMGVAAALPGGNWLTLTPVKGGEPLVGFWLAPEERFTLRYNHSVENAPIWETHSVDAYGRIHIEEERYLKFGAGMGKMPGVGRMVQEGPYEAIQDMHMPTGNFVLRIGSAGVDHTLIWPRGEVNLSALAPHHAVRFSASPITRLKRFLLVWQAPDGTVQRMDYAP